MSRDFVSSSKNKGLFEDFGGLYENPIINFLFEMFNSKKIVSEISVSRFVNIFTSKPSQTFYPRLCYLYPF